MFDEVGEYKLDDDYASCYIFCKNMKNTPKKVILGVFFSKFFDKSRFVTVFVLKP